jgi:hypothetical protein
MWYVTACCATNGWRGSRITPVDCRKPTLSSAHPLCILLLLVATSPSGKARVCKTLTVGSIPTVASNRNGSCRSSRFVSLTGTTRWRVVRKDK